MKTDKLRRLTAASLVLAFTLPQAAQAAAPTVETDESVYINMDYYGAPTNTRIVKGVSLNGHTEFTDFGSYADVYNMSTYDEPVIKDNSVYWKLSDTSKQRFYYECIPTDKVNIQMPWNFDVSYKLNGVSVKAEDCAGANGLVEITIHAVPNSYASDYYKNNMMLVCGTGIDMSKALSIDAPGAQVQSVGTYKLVVFMGMPGEESTFTVRIGSDNFENMGMFMFMTPATLSSLDIISDLKDVKDRLSDSGDSLYSGMSSMLDTMQSMQNGMGTMSSGISGINAVRQQLIKDRGTIDPKTDAALTALEKLTGESDSLIPELNNTKDTLVKLNATTNSILDTLEESGADITEYQTLLQNVRTSLSNLEDLMDDLDDKTGSEWLYISELQNDLSNMKKDLKNIKSDMNDLNDRIKALNDPNCSTIPQRQEHIDDLDRRRHHYRVHRLATCVNGSAQSPAAPRICWTRCRAQPATCRALQLAVRIPRHLGLLRQSRRRLRRTRRLQGSRSGLHHRGQKADRTRQYHARPRQPAADRDSGTDRVAQPADLDHLVLHRQGHRADRHHYQNAHRVLPAARHGQQHTALGSQRRGCQHTDHARRPARCA